MGYVRSILWLSFIFVLSSLASGLISPLWPIYIRSLGASMTELGLVFSISNAVAAVLQIPSGLLSDRFGRKKIHCIGTLLGVFPPLLYTFANNWADLIPWVILSGVSVGLYVPVRWSVVADVSTTKTMATAYSWTNVAWLSGSTVGPLLGGLVADFYGIRAPFLICFALTVLSFPMVLLLRETAGQGSLKTTTQKGVKGNLEPFPFLRVAILFSAMNVIQGVGIGIFSPITSVFASVQFEADYTFLGLLYAVGFGLASIVVQVPGGALANRYDRRKILIVTFIASAPIYGLLATSRNLMELMALMFLGNALLNVSWPAYQALMMDLTSSMRWGLINGISATTFWLGMMLGSALSGLLWDTFGMYIPYYVSALFIFLSVTPSFFLKEPRT